MFGPSNARSPQAWLENNLDALWAGSYDEEQGLGRADPVSLAELVANKAELLRQLHRRLVGEGIPPPAAATYLSGWFGGMLATASGFVLAAGRAGMLTDQADSARSVTFTLHPDGWPRRVDLPARVVVSPDHPWAGRPGVTVSPDMAQVIQAAVASLIRTVTPLVETCHSLARVGRAGLWNEVGDSLGAAMAHQEVVAVDEEMVERLAMATSVPGAPWKARPRLAFVDSERLGRVHVAQKGGCCLAYTRQRTEPPPRADDPDLDADRRAYLTRFPVDPEAPRYCSTCCFRTPADCDARQVFWKELKHQAS